MNRADEYRDAIQAHNIALLALNDLLVDRGVIEVGAWSAQLRRYRAPSYRKGLQAMIEVLSEGFAAGHFRAKALRPPVDIYWDQEPKGP